MDTTKNYQIIQKLENNELLILHPETDAVHVIVDKTSAGINSTNVQDAIKEINDNVKSVVNKGIVTGVKGDSETTYRTGNVNINKSHIGLGNVNNVAITESQVTQIGTNKTNISNLSNRVTTNEQNITNAQSTADEAKSIAEGRAKAVVFDTYANLVTELKSANNTKYKIGDNLFIKETNVPDYWISKVLTNNSGTYGYYEISPLETQKVDLSNYLDKQTASNTYATKTSLNELNNTVDTYGSIIQTLDEQINGGGLTPVGIVTEISNIKVSISDITDGTTKVKKSEYSDTAGVANKLKTARKIEITGDATGSTTFDGNADSTINLTLANSGVNAGTYSVVSVNAKGIVTKGAQMIEVGATGQTTPSSNLAIGGLFFKEI